jgi:heme/copper-type cytochrome/quinol oxidase subunit 1
MMFATDRKLFALGNITLLNGNIGLAVKTHDTTFVVGKLTVFNQGIFVFYALAELNSG